MVKKEVLALLQPHTIKIYNLQDEDYSLETVSAKSLLHPLRFDLFAKLFYIENRRDYPDLAYEVYVKHILAFNPDGREPGRDDKDTIEKFIETFDTLIDCFAKEDFDSTQSIVPVGKNGIILDGAHRIAALAYYDKEVTVARFENIAPKCKFDYSYFLSRGLSNNICDIIASEMINKSKQQYVACLWPRLGTKKRQEEIRCLISNRFPVIYERGLNISLPSLISFVARVYKKQDWIGSAETGFEGARDKAMNVYGKGGSVKFLFFESDSIVDVTAMKEEIRGLIGCGKHSIHITDNQEETIDIASAILDESERRKWLRGRDNTTQVIVDYLKEKYIYIRYIWWINLKVRIVSFLKRLAK